MHALLGTQFNQVVLIEQRRARPHKTHVADQNAPQLRQLVQAAFAQKAADGRQVSIRVA